MFTKNFACVLATVAVLAVAMTGNVANAAPISILNPSFEPAGASPPDYVAATPPSWTAFEGWPNAGSGASIKGSWVGIAPPTQDGEAYWGAIRDLCAFYQQIGTVQNNGVYTFTFWQCSQGNDPPTGVSLGIWAGDPHSGGTLLDSESFALIPQGDTQFAQRTAVLNAGTAYGGQPLYLQFLGTAPASAHGSVLFDGVAGSVDVVPEPASLALLAAGLLGLLAYAWRKRK